MPGIALAGPNPDSSANAEVPVRQPGNPITTQIGRITTLPVLERSQSRSPTKSLFPRSRRMTMTTTRPRPRRTTTCRHQKTSNQRRRTTPSLSPDQSPSPDSTATTPHQASRQRRVEGRTTQNPSPQQRRAAFEGAGPSATVGTASVSTQEDEEPTLTTTEVSLTSQSRLSEAPVLFSAGARDLPPARESFVSVATNLVTAGVSPSALSGPEAPIESPLMWAVFAFRPPPSGLGLGARGAVQWMSRAPTG